MISVHVETIDKYLLYLWPMNKTLYCCMYKVVLSLCIKFKCVTSYSNIELFKLLSSSSCGTVYISCCTTRWFYLISLWMKSWCVTILMKAIERYFHVVLFIMLYKVALPFEACGWNPSVWPFKWKLLRSTFMWCSLLCCTRWFNYSALLPFFIVYCHVCELYVEHLQIGYFFKTNQFVIDIK